MTANASNIAAQVRLIWIEKRIQYWLLFGQPFEETITDRRRKTACFKAGQVFALVRWKSNDYGTVFSAIDILQATSSGGDDTGIRAVKGHVLSHLSLIGWPKVRQVMEHVDAIRAQDIDPENVCPDHWQHVQSRIAAGEEPRSYSAERHAVWLKRGSFEA